MKTLPSAAVILVGACSALTALAQDFVVNDLGNPTPAASALTAQINDRGTIVLTSSLTGGYDPNDDGMYGQGGDQIHAWRNGAFHRVMPFDPTLPGMRAVAINQHDVIAGWSFDNEAIDHSNAFVFDLTSGVMRNLYAETNHQVGGFTFDLNDAGVILGNDTLQWEGNAWVYDGQTVTVLDTVHPEEKLYYAINNQNRLLGRHFDDQSGSFLYDLDTGAVEELGDQDFWLLNDQGVAAGWDFDANALVVRSGGVSRLFPTPGSSVTLEEINNANWIVGSYVNASGARRAFWFDGATGVDLNTRANPPSGWTLVTATGINDRGQIVGEMQNASGARRLYRLDPVGITSNRTWKPIAIAPQYGRFTITFDATPSDNSIDGVMGLSRAEADYFTDMAAIVRFAPSGRIDARNGSSYQAAQVLNYQGGVNYHVSMTVDLWAKRYSATVTPPGGTPVVIANAFAFRTEHRRANELKFLNLYATGGTLTVRNVLIQPPSSGALFSAGTWENAALADHGDSFTVTYDVTPSRLKLDAVTGLSHGMGSWFDDLAAIVRFAPSGVVDARNGGRYQAASALTYAAGVTYRVRMTVNLATHRYSATVTPAGGATKTIANNYAFRTEQAGVSKLDTFVLFSSGGGAAEVKNLTVD